MLVNDAVVTHSDMVAVPDYSAGAMENWGLITFKEHILVANIFVHPEVPDVRRDVIAHELAHQRNGKGPRNIVESVSKGETG
ncbi:hypothetical protein ANCDUO_17278 [Ancylostoma duodenale]|uniref:Peptidase M1 membrane alanine aminopeptidase domain-containing protein n=1 Tax=Ancylostoma duodenale TaxID=51022 RepID=A0A0C2C8E2_9BILA|nr:hypothetical protein ANCDUO_17278 [Ancylostoma duodenale]